jgi:hypothetical protein
LWELLWLPLWHLLPTLCTPPCHLEVLHGHLLPLSLHLAKQSVVHLLQWHLHSSSSSSHLLSRSNLLRHWHLGKHVLGKLCSLSKDLLWELHTTQHLLRQPGHAQHLLSSLHLAKWHLHSSSHVLGHMHLLRHWHLYKQVLWHPSCSHLHLAMHLEH